MWKRIRSNRDPRDTLFKELRREFGPYIDKLCGAFKTILLKRPKIAFALMVFLLMLSAGLSFTMFRNREAAKKLKPADAIQVSSGFSEIMGTAVRLRKTIRLKELVDSLSAAKHLTTQDSVLLGDALDSLASLQQSLNPKNHEN